MVELDRAPADAKPPIYRQLSATEARRKRLERELSEAKAGASDRIEAEVSVIVRQVLDTARENLAAAGTPEKFNRLVEQMCGTLTIDHEGRVIPRPNPERSQGAVVSADSIDHFPQWRTD
jgi:hypothetical protein